MKEKEMERMLNETKRLEFIPGCKGKYMDIKMLADYYEVREETIRTFRKRNIIELTERNLILIKRNNLGFYFDLKKYITLKPYNCITILRYNDDFEFTITNIGKYLFPIECIFYIGILLKDSNISKELKKNLNKFETVYIERKELSFLRKLEECLAPFNIKGIKQYNVDNYRIDYYISNINIAIEYNENKHTSYTYEQQEKRQAYIEKKLHCKFIRVNDSKSDEYNIGLIFKYLINKNLLKNI